MWNIGYTGMDLYSRSVSDMYVTRLLVVAGIRLAVVIALVTLVTGLYQFTPKSSTFSPRSFHFFPRSAPLCCLAFTPPQSIRLLFGEALRIDLLPKYQGFRTAGPKPQFSARGIGIS